MSGALNNPNYLVEIASQGTSVIGRMSEQFALEIQSDWESTMAGLATAGALGKIASGTSLFGYTPYDKILTGQIWRGSGPLEFQLDLKFDAQTDTIADVSDPVQQLIKWASPTRAAGNWFIQAPGPTIFDQTKRLSIRIGQFAYFDNVILPRVSVTWVTAPDSNGQYIGADVMLSCKTFFTPDANDIAQYFGSGPSTSNDALYSPSDDVRQRGQQIENAIKSVF